MRQKSIILVVALALLISAAVLAAPDEMVPEATTGISGWAVFTNVYDDTIQTIDLSTNTVYGPFLAGQLGSGELLDVSIVPGGRYALVSNFEMYTIYRIDLLNPKSPVLAGSVVIPFLAEDIAIAPNGAFALVTDAGATHQVASISLSPFTLETAYTMTTEGAYPTAVAIAPDSKTVVLCDFYANRIIYGAFNAATGFTSESTLPTGSGPLNVTISPNGKTVLVANYFGDSLSAYAITGPGALTAGSTISEIALPQTVVFAPNSAKAYVTSMYCWDYVSWLNVTGPGAVSLGAADVASLTGHCGSSYYGVDQMAMSADGKALVVAGYYGGGESKTASPGSSACAAGGKRRLGFSSAWTATNTEPTSGTSVAIVSTTGFGVTNVPTGGYYPAGIAVLGSAFDMSFYDDAGTSQVCVNSTTGLWQWNVLKGVGLGQSFTSTGVVQTTSTGFTLTSKVLESQWGMRIQYYKAQHQATGFFQYVSKHISSNLTDINTLNDPPGCAGH